jgi:hypothetical protein
MQKSNESRKTTDATATTHSITLSDLAMMHTALDSQLSRWRELGKTNPTHVSAESAGFSKISNTAEVIYGYCDESLTRFYVYVLNERPPSSSYLGDTEGYALIKDGNPFNCHPAEWIIYKYVPVTEESGWYFGLMATGRGKGIRLPTLPSFATATPSPTDEAF